MRDPHIHPIVHQREKVFRMNRFRARPESQRIFTKKLNRRNHQTLFYNSSVTQATHIADFGAGSLGSLEEGVFDETLCSLDLYRSCARVL
jgi:hypothetical protein